LDKNEDAENSPGKNTGKPEKKAIKKHITPAATAK
jgi:hypothetical protein